jgi:hypothetical protein
MSIKIRDDRCLRSLTGLNQEQFEILLETFTATCLQLRFCHSNTVDGNLSGANSA